MKFTTVLGKFEKFNQRLSGWFEWLGIAALLLIIVVTLIDVIGGLFAWRLSGAIDLVQISQAVALTFAAAMVLILDKHVQVTFLFDRMPRRTQAVTESIIHFLELGLFVLIVWRLFVFGHYMQTGGEGTPTIRIPLYPFCYGMAVALIPVCLAIILRIVNSLAKVVRR